MEIILLALLALPRGANAVALRPQAPSQPRRVALQQQACAALGAFGWLAAPAAAAAATAAPYAAGCAALPRTLVVRSGDVAATATFFEKALGLATVERAAGGGARVSFGPSTLDRPADFYPGVSSLDLDGGHFALDIVPFEGVVPEADDAYVQLAVPAIRASLLSRYGGELVSGYGVWDVIAPGGLALRLVVGDEPRDRAMFVAYGVENVKKSAAFYEASGFRRAP